MSVPAGGPCQAAAGGSDRPVQPGAGLRAHGGSGLPAGEPDRPALRPGAAHLPPRPDGARRVLHAGGDPVLLLTQAGYTGTYWKYTGNQFPRPSGTFADPSVVPQVVPPSQPLQAFPQAAP